jgi:hypothetical protein
MSGEIEGSEVMGTSNSGLSITPDGSFWNLNYTTHDLLDPQLHHMGTLCGVIKCSEVPMWCNWGSRRSCLVKLRVQKFPCGVIEYPEDHVWCNWGFYTTWENLDPQLHHMGTSEPSITPHMNFWTINYTTHELLDPQLPHVGTSGPSITPHGNCEFWTPNYTTWELLDPHWGFRSSHVM